MSRGVPKALLGRARRNLPPPPDRNAHVYRDLREVAAVEPEAVEPEAVEPEAVEPEAVEPEAVEPEAVEPEAEPSLDMKRAELDAIAALKGVVGAEKLPNKQAVLDAIADADTAS